MQGVAIELEGGNTIMYLLRRMGGGQRVQSERDNEVFSILQKILPFDEGAQ